MGISIHHVNYGRRFVLFSCCRQFKSSFLKLAMHTRYTRWGPQYVTVVCPYCKAQATFPCFDVKNKPGIMLGCAVRFDDLTMEERVAIRLIG